MAIPSTLSQAELLSKRVAFVTAIAGTAVAATDGAITGTLTAIKAKWILGGRKVTSNFRCTLDPANHEAHFRESATESSWVLPPPTLTVETTSRFGSRVNTTRTDTGVGGGGRLEFGKFREALERAVQDAGWKFVYEVAGPSSPPRARRPIWRRSVATIWRRPGPR